MSNIKKADRTKNRILDAAWDMIAESGAQVSLVEIAAKVGMTRQSVYVHFGSRGGLLLALVRRADQRFRIWEEFEAALKEANGCARLHAVLDVWFDFVIKIHPVATDLIRLRATDADAATAWQDRMDDLHAFFVQLTEGLKRDGHLNLALSSPDAADYLWSAVSVQVWDLLVSDRRRSAAEVRKMIREAVMSHLLRQQTAPDQVLL